MQLFDQRLGDNVSLSLSKTDYSQGVSRFKNFRMKTTLILPLIVALNTQCKAQFTLYNSFNSQLPVNQVNDIKFDNNNIKYIATDAGFSKFDGTTWTNYDTVNLNLPGIPVYDIAIDQASNLVWVRVNTTESNVGAVLGKFDGASVDTFLAPEYCFQLAPDVSSTIEIDNSGKIWAIDGWGSVCMNIVNFDGTNWTPLPYPNGDTNYWYSELAQDIAVVSPTEIWVGTLNGIDHYDAGTWTHYDNVNSDFPGDGAWSIEYNNGKIWATTGNTGIASFDGVTWQVYNALNTPVLQDYLFLGIIDFDSQGNMWTSAGSFSSPSGIVKFDGSNWTFYTTQNSNIPGAAAVSIDNNDNVWCWSDDWGIAVLDGSNSATVIATTDLKLNPTLASDYVYVDQMQVNAAIEVYDVTGRRVVNERLESGVLNIQHLQSGMYIAKLKTDKEVRTATFTKL